MSERIPLFSLLPGASWLTEEGRVLAVPGFHEEWIETHPELVGPCKNVCEVVLAKRWISVTLFGGGYVELLVHDRRDSSVTERIAKLLSGASGRWNKALVMAMDEEGYAMLSPRDVSSRETLVRALEKNI